MDDRIENLEKEIEAMKRDFNQSWTLFQDLFGVRFVQEDKRVVLKILTPKKDQGSPGLLSDIYHKINSLWKRYGSDIIVVRR